MTARWTMLWRRLDVPGHDSCRIVSSRMGWRLHGTAVFRHEAGPARLTYEVRVDESWRAREGRVDGWVGGRSIRLRVRRAASGWYLNDAPVEAAGECVDLDFGFTPATNFLSLRRLALDVGQSASVPVAWLDVPSAELGALAQRYERRTPATYWYEAPRFAYAALLEVSPDGFVVRYPGLWHAEE